MAPTAARSRRPARRDSRAEILKAGRAEFAAHGFAGAGVDRIARRARVNKAMVYYHFGSKLALYRAILADAFQTVAAAAQAAVDPRSPAFAQLDAYIRALLRMAQAETHIIPLLLREIAEGGRKLDPASMTEMLGIFQVVRGVLERGERAGELRAMNPLLTHFMIMGSAMLYVANEPIRTRIRQLRLPGGPRDVPVGVEPFVAHLELVLRRALGTGQEERHAR